MEDIPIAVVAGAALVAIAPLRRRLVPVAKAMTGTAVGITTAAAGGLGGVVQAALHGDRGQSAEGAEDKGKAKPK